MKTRKLTQTNLVQLVCRLLEGNNFKSQVCLKLKCKNFDSLKKKVKINNKSVVLKPYKLFNRQAVVSKRNLTVAESLGYELTVLPASLFNDKQ